MEQAGNGCSAGKIDPRRTAEKPLSNEYLEKENAVVECKEDEKEELKKNLCWIACRFYRSGFDSFLS
jgi:hypothetical protein